MEIIPLPFSFPFEPSQSNTMMRYMVLSQLEKGRVQFKELNRSRRHPVRSFQIDSFSEEEEEEELCPRFMHVSCRHRGRQGGREAGRQRQQPIQ